ncbi:copper resistance protein CopC [Micromonospora sp. NPDC049102]|uniref:copper resistance CopC family protein n=1 Tax=Micromonospora sp. NPDC049102 TaxID=3364265 RepID=UPI00371D905D
MTASPSRPIVIRLGSAVLAVVVATLIPASPAWAHNALRSAAPVQESTLSRAPTEIVLEFAQRLDPAFATIVLTDAAKRRVPTGAPVFDGAKGSVPVPQALPNGTYTVAYRVVSTDGHPAQGSYPFTVADPDSSVAPVVSTTIDEASAPRERGTSAGVLAGGAAAAVLVVAGVGLRWRRARRR